MAAAIGMKRRIAWKWIAQILVVLAVVFFTKLYYSTASANQLRWILAPTTACVELVSGVPFEFESNAGYISADRTFLIATSCAGVNFLITAFLLLSLSRLLRDRPISCSWGFIATSALSAYLVTLIANSTRIAVALRFGRMPADLDGMSPDQLHRFEGIFVYFGFLILLFVVSERANRQRSTGLLRPFVFPLVVYYATMLGLPLANGAYRRQGFLEHALCVFVIPLALSLPLAAFSFLRRWRSLPPDVSLPISLRHNPRRVCVRAGLRPLHRIR